MASKIRILDEKTINQIAAGEVIESPASVVKELVDNAIDAHATKIVVEAVNSGRQLIRVQDNGSGMGHDDALLCIERHATSKIRSLDDLWALATMGFRGEALSSVASISEFSLLTAPQNTTSDQAEGSLLQVSGGKIVSHEKVKCLSGTTIEVKSLFYNVPARKKFLKSPAKDASDITKILVQTALANPQVAFELILNHKREFSWQASSAEERIRDALGGEFFSELMPISYQKDDIRIHGFVANPSFSRPTRAYQYLFVNNRPVVSLPLSHAVKEAYGSSLDPVRHPAFVLFIDIATTALDVNVHPQKKEVRFSFEDDLKRVLIEAVSSALFTRNTSFSALRPAFQQPPTSERSARAPVAPFPSVPREFTQHEIRELEYSVQNEEPQPQFTQLFLEQTAHAVSVQVVFDDFIIADILWPAAIDLPEELAQEGLYLISAKRALSRLAFDGASLPKELAKVSSQTLLVPVFIETSAHEAGQLRALLPQLEQAGIVISDFGRASFLVQAIPGYLEASCINDIIRRLLDDEGAINNLAVTLAKACKTSNTQKPLSKEAASHVVKKLLECVNPFQCPAGDKIVSIFTKNELEKKFR